MDLSAIPQHWCSHRFVSGKAATLVVIHTNEGPEGPKSAENLAHYLARGDVTPGYHYIVDENSVVQGCPLTERCYGAGGVNARAIHICITGYAAQTTAEWGDPSSKAALALAADLCRAVCAEVGIPHVRIVQPATRSGVCGHADISRYYPSSKGHTDPGANFPWAKFMGSGTPKPPAARLEDMTEFLYRNPTGGAIFLVEGAARMHVSPDQKALYVWAAALDGRKIVDLGNLSKEQIEAANRIPLVGG